MALSQVVLLSGRSIKLSDVRLFSTYDNLVEGYPCARFNDMKINALLRGAERDHPGTPIHLVDPPRTYPDTEKGPWGPVEILPEVCCVGTFHSTPTDPDLYRSSLTVIWFQPSPKIPSGTDADPRLRAVEWEELARDWEL